MTSLDIFFNPESIAVFGASRNPSKVGYQLLRNLMMSYRGRNLCGGSLRLFKSF